MFTDPKIEAQFFNEQRSEKLPFVINDSVKITSGSQKGKSAAVVSVLGDGPDLKFLVETSDGFDIEVSGEFLELIE